MIDTISGIQVEECRQSRFDMSGCKYFSHFGPNNYPISNHCMVFSTCPVLENCKDCYTLGIDLNCQLLLENGADSNVFADKQGIGLTPLHLAKTQNVVNLLIKHGANPFTRQTGTKVWIL